MISIILGSLCFFVVIVMTVLLGCGCPLGEFTMGGQHPVIPKKLRIAVWFMLLIQIFGLIILLQNGGLIPLFCSQKVTRRIGIGFAVYFCLNTVMNGLSRSKKERYLMTPLSTIVTVCFWVTLYGNHS